MKVDSVFCLPILAVWFVAIAFEAAAQAPQTPMTRMQPIGSPSAVDRYSHSERALPDARREGGANQDRQSDDQSFLTPQAIQRRSNRVSLQPVRDTSRGRAATGTVRRAVFQQPDRDPVTAPQLPSDGMGFPLGATPPAGVSPPPAAGSSATAIPGAGGAASGSSSGVPDGVVPGTTLPPASAPGTAYSDDRSPLPQPQLGASGFATIDNCSCISAPSSYTAASGIDCGSAPVAAAPPTYQAPPARIPEPAIMPPVTAAPPAATPLATTPSGAPARSLITLGQQRHTVQVGQGLWGQPVAYVPGQHVRNWIRYMSP